MKYIYNIYIWKKKYIYKEKIEWGISRTMGAMAGGEESLLY